MYYSKNQAAARLKISAATFDRRRREGLIPPPVEGVRKAPLKWDKAIIDNLADGPRLVTQTWTSLPVTGLKIPSILD
ncbi:hypothetical protein VHN57_02325 [Sphingobium sp. WW5]|jgi:hypothetical protein|uniref:hypothetical protein n=1 Tax=unclassified Sphingobium TaxID=2611147 RepID=UPI003C14A714